MKRRPNRRDLIIVIGRLQSLIGRAKSDHGNDRDRNGFEKGQRSLEAAFDLCIEAIGQDPQIVNPRGPWARP